ncbi:glycosyltransferase involved in cell wall biosynthesis [Actinoplanes octamycinicus]|uniref:Glycosyltransferase involved in cell wall biosynthesis n=1 Tax=Actinoplanes octamycinicus TaxID=135948 RepID=A0A7W7MCL0_9ACTN|nr:glycosyltransferase family 2 protein [Actinoplanes octamycinicus]MBB4745262.1 glycosyltransferase involved in cell wall biosynthesis [Actinoplanes octamycinicus]GIE62260.1 hypothetical protein Aoc01nite_76620 [Actinoplanes octamycinicus]
MRSFSQIAVLLPVHQPGPHLTELVVDLVAQVPAASRIVVVDDGSDPGSRHTVDSVQALGCTVLRHPVNRGKGAALKTGLTHLRSAHPGLDVVCADADGQHHADDIRQVADRIRPGRIVLGVREVEQMPARSRWGNTLTRVLFRGATGYRVPDTQTGLRGFPADLLDRLCEVPGDGFEYEMNVLLDAAATRLPLDTVSIPVRYLNDNKGSHFGSVTDSVRVYSPLLRYALAGLIGGNRNPR